MSGYDVRTTLRPTEARPEVHGRASRLVADLGRLKHTAETGESAATPAILIAAMAICMWALAAILITIAMTVPPLT